MLAQELLHRLTVVPPEPGALVLSVDDCAQLPVHAGSAPTSTRGNFRCSYLVEGTVREIGSRWRVDIRLVDAANDRIEFTDRFVADGPDILALESTIAEAVSGQLALHIGGQLLEPFWDEPVSPPAFLAYVAAAHAAARPNTHDLRTALARADEACTLDETFVPAHILRASLQIQLARNSGGSVTRASTEACAKQCVAAAPRLATGKALDAMLATMIDYDWARADLRYSEITAALPADLHARVDSAKCLAIRRRFVEAQAAIDAAAAIELTAPLQQAQANLHIWKGEFETAANIQDKILTHAEFQYPTTLMQAMVVGMMLRDEERMQALLGLIEPEMQHVYRHILAACLAASKHDGQALGEAHRQLSAAAEAREALWYHVALLDGYAGDAQGAAEHLSRAIDLKEYGIQNAWVAPCFAQVRGDPRFQAQVSRLNLS